MFSGGGRGNSKTSTPPEIPSCIIFGVAKATGSFPVSSELQRPTTLDETWFYFTFYYDSIANQPSFSREIHHQPSDKTALFKEKKYISITSCDQHLHKNLLYCQFRCWNPSQPWNCLFYYTAYLLIIMFELVVAAPKWQECFADTFKGFEQIVSEEEVSTHQEDLTSLHLTQTHFWLSGNIFHL